MADPAGTKTVEEAKKRKKDKPPHSPRENNPPPTPRENTPHPARERTPPNQPEREHPHPAREKTPRHRSIPEIAVRFHLPWKTSQITAEPKEWPKR